MKVKQDPAIKIIQKPFNLKKIVEIIKLRKELKKQPEILLQKFRHFNFENKGKDWILFLLEYIYRNDGKEKLNNFIQNGKLKKNDLAKNLIKSYSNSKRLSNNLFKKSTVLNFWIKNNYLTNIPDEIVEESSEEIQMIAQNLGMIDKKVKSKEIIHMILSTTEIFLKINLEPFYSLLKFILETGNTEKEKIEEMREIHWPTTPKATFPEDLIKNLNKIFICENNHINIINKPNEEKLMKCRICDSRIIKNDGIKKSFFKKPFSYTFSKYPNTNPLYSIRELNPIIFRFIRLAIHCFFLPFIIISEKASKNFISILNDLFFQSKNQDDLINSFLEHIENDFEIFTKLLKFSKEESLIYYYQILSNFRSKFKSQKQSVIDFKNIEGRNSFEKIVEDIYQKNNQKILESIFSEQIEKNELIQEIKKSSSEKKWMFISFERNEIFEIIDLMISKNPEERRKSIIHFIIENSNKLKILKLFPKFLTFSSIIFNELNGKIRKEETKIMKINEFLNQENDLDSKTNLQKIYQDFEKFWNLCLKEIKYLIVKESLPQEFEDIKMNENQIIDYCLPGNEPNHLFIEMMINHSIRLNNEMIKKMKELKEIQQNNHEWNHQEKPFLISFPISIEKFNGISILDIDPDKIEKEFKNQFIDKYFLRILEFKINSQIKMNLTNFRDLEINQINQFIYSNPETIIEQYQIPKLEFKDEKLAINEWEQILNDLEKHSQIKNCQELVKQIWQGIQKIDPKNVTDELFEKTVYDYVLNDLQNHEIEEISKSSPNFKSLKKILSIYQQEMTNLFSSFSKNEILELERIWKEFISTFLKDNLDENEKIKKFLIQIEPENEQLNEQIEKNFPESIKLKFCIGAFKYFERNLKTFQK
ncbi:hypothetical protein M0811_02265 [Anaeramoeba ignava]|uniref:Uncharacterized protein n=1 Tax=Anaeramoeba ignava TaxID=1746090 RepID=A0A9Q0R7V0_ANAIG|nr:hypothetical protein M0811_02265 [Anaeramoeba ignava]